MIKPRRAATLNDVAAEANISNATVSHYLNKTKPVSPATAQRIQQAIDRLGYQKDSMAAWFKTSRAPLVIIAVAKADTSFFSDVADAIEDVCETLNLNVIRVQIGTLEKMRHGNSMMAFLRRATGVIVLGHAEQWIDDPTALEATVPTVALNWDLLAGFNQQGLVEHLPEAAYQAMDFLFSHGHREIGLVTGPLHLPRGQELMAGVRRFSETHNVNIDPSWIIETDYSFSDARHKTAAALLGPYRPTAVLTFGTQFAFGVLQAAWQYNLTVPRDLSVISYIDVKQAEFSTPSLTTISPSLTQLAAHVMDRLMHLSDSEASERSTVLDLILYDRGSVCPPPDAPLSA
jgi:LacI family transcriptional regulator